jgi:hypothetical protein
LKCAAFVIKELSIISVWWLKCLGPSRKAFLRDV